MGWLAWSDRRGMYLGPADSWPGHPRPQARAALEEARQAGWWFKSSAGHGFGRLRCLAPEQDPDNQACKVPIYSTSGSADGSDTARVIRDAVRKCPHGRTTAAAEPDPEAHARLASGKLAQIDALIVAAQSLASEQAARNNANEILEGALRQLEEDENAHVEHLEDEIARLESEASIVRTRAHTAALRAGFGDPWPPGDGARELLALAEAVFDETVGLIARATGTNAMTRLEAERDRLRASLDRLSTLLDSGR
jgi:hypothetical protein